MAENFTPIGRPAFPKVPVRADYKSLAAYKKALQKAQRQAKSRAQYEITQAPNAAPGKNYWRAKGLSDQFSERLDSMRRSDLEKAKNSGAERTYQVGMTVGAMVGGMGAGHVLANGIEKRHMASVKARNIQLRDAAKFSRDSVKNIGSEDPRRIAARQGQAAALVSDRNGLTRPRGPKGGLTALALAGEALALRYYFAPEAEKQGNTAAAEGFKAAGTAAGFAASGVLAGRAIHNATPKVFVTAKDAIRIEKARSVTGAELSRIEAVRQRALAQLGRPITGPSRLPKRAGKVALVAGGIAAAGYGIYKFLGNIEPPKMARNKNAHKEIERRQKQGRGAERRSVPRAAAQPRTGVQQSQAQRPAVPRVASTPAAPASTGWSLPDIGRRFKGLKKIKSPFGIPMIVSENVIEPVYKSLRNWGKGPTQVAPKGVKAPLRHPGAVKPAAKPKPKPQPKKRRKARTKTRSNGMVRGYWRNGVWVRGHKRKPPR